MLQKRCILSAVTLLIGLMLFAKPTKLQLSEHHIIDEIECALTNKVIEVAGQHLDLRTVKPDTNVTDTIRFIDNLGRKLLDVEVSDNRTPLLNEKIVGVIDALKERRIYKYMLWAEGTLERVSERFRRGDCNELQRIQLYLNLGEINVSLVSENMLNREIMSLMSEIYDSLSVDKKVIVRRKSLSQQADPLSRVGSINPRRTLDEF